MTVQLRPLLVRPGDAFEEVSDRPSLLTPGLVVFALGVVLAVQSVPLMALVFGDEPTHAIHLATNTGVVSVASAAPINLAFNAGVAVAAWLVLSAVTHVVARLAGGTGSFRRTLASVAWCAVPWIFVYGSVLVVATAIAATSEATLAGVLGGHAYAFASGAPPAYFDGVGVLDLRLGLFVAGTVLSARIWARAVPSAHGEDLARGSSVVAAAVVVLAVLAIAF